MHQGMAVVSKEWIGPSEGVVTMDRRSAGCRLLAKTTLRCSCSNHSKATAAFMVSQSSGCFMNSNMQIDRIAMEYVEGLTPSAEPTAHHQSAKTSEDEVVDPVSIVQLRMERKSVLAAEPDGHYVPIDL